jgi:hypothetical protein
MSHNAGPNPTRTNDVALMPPIVPSRSANSAGAFHDRCRRAIAVRPISQGRPAHGSNMTDIRSLYCRTYGDSM